MKQNLEESCVCFSDDNPVQAALGRALRYRADFVLLSLGRAEADRMGHSRALEWVTLGRR